MYIALLNCIINIAEMNIHIQQILGEGKTYFRVLILKECSKGLVVAWTGLSLLVDCYISFVCWSCRPQFCLSLSLRLSTHCPISSSPEQRREGKGRGSDSAPVFQSALVRRENLVMN